MLKKNRMLLIFALSVICLFTLTSCGEKVRIAGAGSSFSWWQKREMEDEKAATASIHLAYLDRNANAYAFKTQDKFYEELKQELDGWDFHTLEVVYHNNLNMTEENLITLFDFLSAYSGQITTLLVNDRDLPFTPAVLGRLSEFNNVTILNISAGDDSDLSGLTDMPSVETLYLNCSDTATVEMMGLEHFPNLVSLNIDCPSSRLDEMAPSLRTMERLESLSLVDFSDGYNNRHESMALVSPFSQALVSMSQLRYFNGKPVNEAFFYEPSKWGNLVDDTKKFAESAISLTKVNAEGPPEIDGKIMIVLNTWTSSFLMVDYLNSSESFSFNDSGGILPDSLFAENTDDCDTLIYVSYESKSAGKYSDGVEAFDDDYYINVLQVKKGVRYAPVYLCTVSATFMKSENASGHSFLNYREVYEFIKSIQ